MPVDLIGIPFNLVKNVDLVVANHKHLGAGNKTGVQKGFVPTRTIIALT